MERTAAMAKTIAEKLLIKPHTTVWLSHNEHLPRLTPLPEGVRQVDALEAASVAIVFADSAASVRDTLTQHKGEITRPAVVWVAYPKGGRADINRDSLWPIAGEFGIRPNGQVAIDDVWSGLRFRAHRDGEEPFTGGTT
jgi:hypothetical protein